MKQKASDTILAKMHSLAAGSGRCQVSKIRLTEMTKYCHTTVERALAELERDGAISIEQRGGPRKANVYALASQTSG